MFRALITTGILILATSSFAGVFQQGQGRNSIEGNIVTSDNKVLENSRVFLLNDGYSQVKQTYADASGRYQFKNLNAGDYYVQVEPAGSGYERQMQRVEVNPFTLGRRPGAEIFRVDFVLKPDKSGKRTAPLEKVPVRANGLVFYQDVPVTAKAAYQLGVQSLSKDDLKTAEVNFIEAIKIFPDFYEALDVLGSEYVKHAVYDAAVPLLTHAVEINKDGWHALYSLGVALVESNKRADGLGALHRAVELNPKSINASMRLGLELAKDSQTREEAIKALTNVTQLAGKHLPEAYLVLASLYSKNKQYREAANALEGYLQSSPATNQRESIKRKIQELRHKAQESSSLAQSGVFK
jgi:tetratricopeptide (TPR) repeat protein